MTNLSAVTSDYRRIGRTTLDVWTHYLSEPSANGGASPLLPHAKAMWTEAGEHSALCLAQMKLENDFARTGIIIQPEDGNPLSLRPWIEDPRAVRTGDVIDWKTRKRVRTLKVPPYAVGAVIASDGGMFLRFDNPAMCVREWRRRIADDPGYKHGVYLPAKSLRDFLNIYAPPGDTHPVTGLPNENTKYYEVVTTMLERFAAMEADDTPPDPQEGNDMAGYKKHRFVGLDKDVWLPDDIEVIIDIVPSWRTNIRSNQKFTGQTYTTWHDTGNPNSDARGERNWLHSGAGGSAVGYNFAFDDKRIIQLTPLDEVTWAAGTPDGNRYSWHAEQCLAGNWDKTLRIGAALHGGLIAAKGWDVNKALVQHNVWYGKHCPAQIRNRGLWPTVVKMVAQAAAAARAAALGQDTGDAVDEVENGWPYPDPTPPSFWSEFQKAGTTHFDDGGTIWYKTNALYRVKTKTKRQQYAVQDERVVGPEMPEGLEFRAAAVGQSKTDNKAWVITPMLTRVRLDDLEFAENPDVSAVIAAVQDTLDSAQ